jgi:phosphoribosylamine--glycine ligase
MGAYSTDFILSGPLRERVLDQIIRPTIQGMAAEGSPYQGILYAGLMLTAEGPKTLEFNVRFGDPETQAVLPRLRGDLLEVLDAVASVRLNKVAAKWSSDAAVCVVMASGGYPGAYEKGKTIVGLDLAAELAEVVVFHAGTAVRDNRIVTEGGRVLGVTAQAPSLEEAILRAYEGVNRIHFDGVYFRRDIAAKGLRKSRDS